ncbi:enoyl-CoA hydratase/isomerase family protein (plasmid) [Phaeobacter sp. G2]|nr:enoyl-CoA hydratase/isomerase family protein [Phaeobacter sp. G2]
MISINKHAAMATVTFAPVQGHVSLSGEQMQHLTRVALDFHDDFSTTSVVLRTSHMTSCEADEAVCYSVDAQSSEAKLISMHYEHMCSAWRAMPQVTIAAIEGGVVGAAAALTLSCDWRVMAESAYLQMSGKIGEVLFDASVVSDLVSMVGHAKTLQYLILGDRVAPECALKASLVEWIAPDGLAAAMAADLAQRVAARPVDEVLRQKRAVSSCKEALFQAAGLTAY